MSEIAVREPAAQLAVAGDIDSWTQVAGQVIKLANEICNTPFVPDGLRGSAPATAAAILAGRELGLGPFASLGNIHVIKGKTGLSALLMRALIQAQGHDWQDVKVTDTEAVVKGRRKGEKEWTEAAFTAAQARTAKIDLGGYPQDKLYARATSRLARRKFADVIAGMPYSAEELEDEPGETPATGAPRRSGRITAAEITARPSAPQTASPADTQVLPVPAAPHRSPVAEPAGEAPPAMATGAQIGFIEKAFEKVGYDLENPDDQQYLLYVAASLAGRDDITTLNQLTQDQAARVRGWLARCEDADQVKKLLEAGETPDA